MLALSLPNCGCPTATGCPTRRGGAVPAPEHQRGAAQPPCSAPSTGTACGPPPPAAPPPASSPPLQRPPPADHSQRSMSEHNSPGAVLFALFRSRGSHAAPCLTTPLQAPTTASTSTIPPPPLCTAAVPGLQAVPPCLPAQHHTHTTTRACNSCCNAKAPATMTKTSTGPLTAPSRIVPPAAHQARHFTRRTCSHPAPCDAAAANCWHMTSWLCRSAHNRTNALS
jgi:hypothetical protein